MKIIQTIKWTKKAIQRVNPLSNDSPLNNVILRRRGDIPSVLRAIMLDGMKPDSDTMSYAIDFGSKELVHRLLEMGVEVNSTALNAAIDIKNPEMVQFILNAGGKPDRYSLSMSQRSGNPQIVKLIQSAIDQYGLVPEEEEIPDQSENEEKPIMDDEMRAVLKSLFSENEI